MFWAITGGIIYVILMVTLGVISLRKGHWFMFINWTLLAILLAHRRADAFPEARLLGEPAVSLLR